MAKKDLNLSKIKLFDPKGLHKVAERHRGRFYKRVTVDGKDYQGNQFPRYSKKYQERLENDFRKDDGSRYAGFEGRSPTTSGAKRSRRQFLLTGDTMSNFKVVTPVGKDHYVLRWTGEAAAIVDGNADRGRNIKDGIPPDEFAAVLKDLGLLVDKEFKKIPNVTRIRT